MGNSLPNNYSLNVFKMMQRREALITYLERAKKHSGGIEIHSLKLSGEYAGNIEIPVDLARNLVAELISRASQELTNIERILSTLEDAAAIAAQQIGVNP